MVARVAAAITQAQELSGGARPVLVAHSGVIRAARHLTCGSAHGASPINTTPYLFAPHADSWRETVLRGRDAKDWA
jgi:probable phosphoglycerate mutase